MVMNLDKCIGCHTCSVTCKQAWTNRSGVEYVWFNNVETRPGQGYPRTYEDQEKWKGGWKLGRNGRLQLRTGSRLKRLLTIFSSPKHAVDRRLLRALDLRLRDADQRPGRRSTPRWPGPRSLLTDKPMKHRVERQLGRQPRRRPGAHPGRPGAEEDLGGDQARSSSRLHVLPAADLRALPQPVVRGVLPVRGDLQARRGRHRPGRPGPLPRLADVRHRLPVQEGLLQPPHRQGREVHVLLPARRGRHPDRLLGDLRGPAALHRASSCTTPTGCWRRRPTPDEQDLYAAQRSVFLDPHDPEVHRAPPSRPASRGTGSTPPSARRSGR